jgi:Tfp pilus assembly protein PilF
LIALGILLATFAAYYSVLHFGFIGFDDLHYVTQDMHLRDGLTLRNLRWVFLSFDPDNWFPVTRLSLLADYKLFGLRAGLYHAENVLIHALAALLLFGFLRRATRVLWPSAFVALMFALHPLHVESVAWIAERKDVLCAFFWFAALWAWLRYTERPGPARYADTLVLFSLGLMSKPMIVTLPFLLILLDIWPLRRAFSRKLILEKIPFFALSGAVAAITVFAQRSAGALPSGRMFPLALRIGNACLAVASYIADTLWPAHLWVLHAYPPTLPATQAIAAGVAIAAVSVIALREIHRRPYFTTGWFWFLGTLVPVIGLVQAGMQARADRYMYVPMVGLAIALAWGAAEIVGARPALHRPAAVLATVACLAMAIRTSYQTRYWGDTEVLFRHAIAMDNRNYLAWNYLGETIEEHPERSAEIISAYRNALRLRPGFADPHNNLGAYYCHTGRTAEGIAEYRAALRIDPDQATTHANLGEALAKTGRRDEAIGEYETALRLNPRSAAAHNDLGALLWKTPGRADEGLRHLETAVEIDPDYAQAQSNLGHALLGIPGREADSVPHFVAALRSDPKLVAAHLGLASVLIRVPGMQIEAIAHLQAAQRIEPTAERRRLLDQLEQLRPK